MTTGATAPDDQGKQVDRAGPYEAQPSTPTLAPPADQPKADDQGKTFTQVDVDRIVKQRAERVAAEKYGDYSDLQAKAKKLDKLEQANATELERAVEKARSEGRTEVTEAANTRLVAAEARALAAEARFRNPSLAVRTIDLTGVEVADDGTVDTAALKSLLDTLAADEPYLVDDGKAPKPKPDNAQGQPKGTPASMATPGLGRLREAYAESTSKT